MQKNIENWENRCHTNEFGWDVDADKLIPFVKSLLAKQRENIFDEIEKRSEIGTMYPAKLKISEEDFVKYILFQMEFNDWRQLRTKGEKEGVK